LRLRSIEVSDGGVTLSWGVDGTEIVRVRVVGDEVFVRVLELVRKSAVDDVVEESVACVKDLGRCAERIKPRLDRSELAEEVRDLIMMLDEGECIELEEVMEYAALKGFAEDDAEEVLRELVARGEVEDKGRCYAPAEEGVFDP